MKYKISVIVASYNYEQYIRTTLDSLANQTYKNFEVIIVDDGSSDNSVNIIKEYTEKYDNFYLYQHENNSNKGLSATLQLGISKADGDYIAFLESDDFWDINYLKEKADFINIHKKYKLITNDIKVVGDTELSEYVSYISGIRNYFVRNKKNTNHFGRLVKTNDCMPTFSAVMIEKKILETLDFNSPIPEWLDWWLWRQYAIKYPIGFVDKKLTFWRKHNASYDRITGKNSLDKCSILTAKSDQLLKRKYSIQYYKYFCIKNVYAMIKKIFEIKNSPDGRHKILTLLGIKIKFNKIHHRGNFQFVSLGYNCLTRRVLTEVGLMKSKEQGQPSYPFDLCVTFPNKIVEILNKGFEGYLDNIVYDVDKKGYYNTKYNIFYNHDEDCDNDEFGYKKIIHRYKNRIDNFKKLISANENIIYVINNYYQSEKVLNKLYKVLNKISHKNFFLVVLDFEDKINQNLLNKRILVCKIKHPFEHIDHCWYPENIEKFNIL